MKKQVPVRHWDRAFAPSSCLAMITTVDGQGRVNAGSFGTCVRVCHDPLYVSFTSSVGKDTTRNVLETGEFVVNVPPFEKEILGKVGIVGLRFAPGVNELDRAGLTALASTTVRPPRIAECKSHFECCVEWTREWVGRVMVVGKVVAVSIDEDCVDVEGYVVWDRLRPAHYCGGPYSNRFVAAYQVMDAGLPYEGSEAGQFLEQTRHM